MNTIRSKRIYESFSSDGAGGGSSVVTQDITTTTVLTAPAAGTITTIFVDATAGDITITLPTAVGNINTLYLFKRIDSTVNLVTIDTTGSETIDGVSSVNLNNEDTVNNPLKGLIALSITGNNADYFII
jgi:hypothetical protein